MPLSNRCIDGFAAVISGKPKPTMSDIIPPKAMKAPACTACTNRRESGRVALVEPMVSVVSVISLGVLTFMMGI